MQNIINEHESLYNVEPIGRWHIWHSNAGPTKGHRRKGGHQTNETEILFVGRGNEFEGS